MVFARVMYEERPYWAVLEGKYLRLIDGAPHEPWEYRGTQVRVARAQLCAPCTSQLHCIHADTGAHTYKAAARVAAPMQAIALGRKAEMDCLCGIAVMIGAQGIQGYTAYGAATIGPYVEETLCAQASVQVVVNGAVRACVAVAPWLEMLQQQLAQGTFAIGDVVACVAPFGKLEIGDTLAVKIEGIHPLEAHMVHH